MEQLYLDDERLAWAEVAKSGEYAVPHLALRHPSERRNYTFVGGHSPSTLLE